MPPTTVILVGRVLEGASAEADTVQRGVPGVRVYLDDRLVAYLKRPTGGAG